MLAEGGVKAKAAEVRGLLGFCDHILRKYGHVFSNEKAGFCNQCLPLSTIGENNNKSQGPHSQLLHAWVSIRTG